MRTVLLLSLALASCTAAMRVMVTGAGGRTGKLTFKKLNEDYDSITPVGLARSKKAVKQMKKMGASAEQIVRADTTVEAEVTSAMEGCDAVILCTSAVPAIKPLSIVKILFKKTILRYISKN